MTKKITPLGSVEAYTRLNEAVFEVFFDGRYQQRPVYMEIADDRVEEISAKLQVDEGDLDEFIGMAVAETFMHGDGDPYAWHLQQAKRWTRARDPETPPPFLGVLALLSLAAERMRDDGEFSSHNYYTRLIDILQAEGTSLESRVRNYARSTRAFWRSLNQWLTENDFELGRPTAMQVNSWTYVSYALSQALVRDADRQRFHSLFREFNLSPLDDVSVAEMLLFLHEWMAGGGPNAWLRKLWSTTDLRERIASSALVELKNWDGGDVAKGPRARQLAWTASLSGFPRKRLGLFLTTVGVQFDDEISVTPIKPVSEALSAALEGCGGEACLAPSATGDFSVLEPVSGINLSALLMASVQFETKSGEKFSHTPRPIVPLVQPDGTTYYREVQRASLLRRHVVLCHEEWMTKVQSHLAACARPGFVIKTSDDLPGLPADWRLVEDVEIVRVLDDARANLASLVPLSEGIAVQLEGGFRLAPQIWHSQLPPGILATSDRGDFDVVVRHQVIDAEDKELFKRSSRGGSCIVEPSAFERGDASEVTIVAKVGSKEASEKALAFRDAGLPRPLRKYETAYDLASQCTAGFETSTIRSKSWIEGLVITGAPPSVVVDENVRLKPALSRSSPATPTSYIVKPVSGLGETCFIRGYHVWHCETAIWSDPSWEAKRMDCKDCRMSVVLRNRGKRKKAPAHASHHAKSKPVTAPPVTPERFSVSQDLVFDGLSYLGEGTWNAFQGIVAASSDDPWAATALSRDLKDLGHLDFRCDKSGRPSHWRVSAPALVFTEDGDCFLAGFRSSELVDAVGDALEGVDAEFAPENGELARIAWRGVAIEDAREALSGVMDAHGRKIAVVNSPALAIAKAAWPSSKILAAAPPIHVDSLSDLEVFVPSEGRWRKATSLKEPGAYRTHFAGRRYFYRDEAGEARATSVGLAKVLAAKNEGIALHAFNASSRELVGQLGCELPGLLGRAATSCSGRLAREDKGQFSYGNVSADVANMIISKVYG